MSRSTGRARGAPLAVPESPRAGQSGVTRRRALCGWPAPCDWPAVVSSPQQSVLLIIYIIIYNHSRVNPPRHLFYTACTDSFRTALRSTLRGAPRAPFRSRQLSSRPQGALSAGVGDAWTSFSGPARHPRAREPPPGCPRHPAAPGQARSAPLPAAPLTCMRQSVVTDSRPPGSWRRRSSPGGSRSGRPAACRGADWGPASAPRAPDSPAVAPSAPACSLVSPFDEAARQPRSAPGSAPPAWFGLSRRLATVGSAPITRAPAPIRTAQGAHPLPISARRPSQRPRPASPRRPPARWRTASSLASRRALALGSRAGHPPAPPQFPPAPASARDLRRLHPLRKFVGDGNPAAGQGSPAPGENQGEFETGASDGRRPATSENWREILGAGRCGRAGASRAGLPETPPPAQSGTFRPVDRAHITLPNSAMRRCGRQSAI